MSINAETRVQYEDRHRESGGLPTVLLVLILSERGREHRSLILST